MSDSFDPVALQERLAALEQTQALGSFMSQFGNDIPALQNKDVATEIMNRLEATEPGMVQRANLEAVQSIAEQLKQEAEATRDQLNTILSLFDTKVNNVQDAITDVTGTPPDMLGGSEPPAPEALPADMSAPPMPPADMSAPPMPPADMSAPPVMPDQTMDAGLPPPPVVPQQEPVMPSSAQIKNIHAAVVAQSRPTDFKAPRHMLSAIKNAWG